jgi:molybdenum cofactor synthesis domain-containing protein
MASKFKSSATTISTDNAVGTIIAHDITEICPGKFKGPAFKKGHLVRKEDIEHLKRLGKEHLYLLDISSDEMHENDAALTFARSLAGENIYFDKEPCEGKITLKSACYGLLKVDTEALTMFNMVPDISCASRHNNSVVDAGDIVGMTRAIPLIIEKNYVTQAIRIAKEAGAIFSVKALSKLDAGLIITGNEVYFGRVEDKFAPVIRKKIETYGCQIKETIFSPDDKSVIIKSIRKLLNSGCLLIIITGGMSVDPDDVTKLAIAEVGTEDVIFGTPVLPGAMFLYGRYGDIPVLGLPACVIYYRTTIFDIILPRVLAGETISREDIAAMAHGGMCLNCERCRYPLCPFGK